MTHFIKEILNFFFSVPYGSIGKQRGLFVQGAGTQVMLASITVPSHHAMLEESAKKVLNPDESKAVLRHIRRVSRIKTLGNSNAEHWDKIFLHAWLTNTQNLQKLKTYRTYKCARLYRHTNLTDITRVIKIKTLKTYRRFLIISSFVY